jgi:hypothetical protein
MSEMCTDRHCVARKTAAQALIEAELRQTAQVADDDPRLPVDVDVFPVSLARGGIPHQALLALHHELWHDVRE